MIESAGTAIARRNELKALAQRFDDVEIEYERERDPDEQLAAHFVVRREGVTIYESYRPAMRERSEIDYIALLLGAELV